MINEEKFPDEFIQRMQVQLGSEFNSFVQSMSQPAPISVRFNPFKKNDGKKLFADEEKVTWCSDGKYLQERPSFTFDPNFHAGLYYVQDGQPMKALKQSELKIVTDKKRQVLKILAQIPVLNGKSHLEMDGLKSAFVVTEERPEFYFRLASEERFGLVRCTPSPKGTGRIVERWEIIPVVKEVMVQHEEVQIFRKQVGEGLYKVWPMEPLTTGEYAWIEFTEGKGNTQVWDFSYSAKK